jgi:hypothetical protein
MSVVARRSADTTRATARQRAAGRIPWVEQVRCAWLLPVDHEQALVRVVERAADLARPGVSEKPADDGPDPFESGIALARGVPVRRFQPVGHGDSTRSLPPLDAPRAAPERARRCRSRAGRRRQANRLRRPGPPGPGRPSDDVGAGARELTSPAARIDQWSAGVVYAAFSLARMDQPDDAISGTGFRS